MGGLALVDAGDADLALQSSGKIRFASASTSTQMTLDNGNLTTTGSITADHFHGKTEEEDYIKPTSMLGSLGFVAGTGFGSHQRAAWSDTDARVNATFFVRKGGSFKIRMNWSSDTANTSKTMSGVTYISTAIDGGVIGFVGGYGDVVDTAIPDAAWEIQSTTAPTAATIGDLANVFVMFVKDDNAGGASGDMVVHDIVLVRQ
jgi:hypothetical protein